MDENSLRLLLAQGVSVEEIGRRFNRDPSTVSYWMRKYGLQAPNREKYAAKGGIERERLEALVAAGRSIAEIAAEVGRSKGTVRHWLTRYGLRTDPLRARRSARARAAREAGLLTVTMTCVHHGDTEFVLEGRSAYRCKRCRLERVVAHRRSVKARLVAEAGGRCALCGYDRYLGALQFHHLDPREKRIGLSHRGNALAIDTLRAEAAKCALLCSNCHAEVEAGVRQLALQSEPLGDDDVPRNQIRGGR